MLPVLLQLCWPWPAQANKADAPPLPAPSPPGQHCSTDEAIRSAAEEAGKAFAAFKAAAKTRDDVFAKVQAYAASAKCTEETGGDAYVGSPGCETFFAQSRARACCSSFGDSLHRYKAHFVAALVSDFKRGGLALSTEERKELQVTLKSILP